MTSIPQDKNLPSHSRVLELEKLRAEIWKIALITEDKTTLVQALLDKTGPVLGCDNVSFMPYDKNMREIVVAQQWRADGQNTGLGQVVPKWIFKRYLGRPFVQISFDEMPAFVQPVLRVFQKKYGTRSALVVPYGDPHAPAGYISVSHFAQAKVYAAEEIDIFIELSNIIYLRSKQLQSQEARAASELRYRQIFETNRSVKLIIDPNDGRILEANQAAVLFYGYDKAKLSQMRVMDINPRPEAEVRHIMQVVRNRELFFFETSHRLASGDIRDVEIYVSPVESDGGAINYCIIHDITERKRAEEKLLQLSRAVEQSGSAIAITNADGAVEFVNPAFTRITGYSAQELAGRNLRLLKSGNTPPSQYDDLWATITSGKVWQGEFVNRRKDGELYRESAIISPIKDESGKISHFVAVKEDITQRKLEENIMQARLRLIDFSLSHSLEELLQSTLDEAEALTGSVIGFYHFLGADQKTLNLQAWSTNTVNNLCTAEVKDHQYDLDIAGVWVDCVKQRRPVIHNDYAALPHRKGTPKGHALVIRELVIPVFRGERIVAILGVGNKSANYNEGDVRVVSLLADLAWDIVERKQAERALQESNQSLAAALTELRETQERMVRQERLAAVGQLVAGIAHDFNNILASILGYTELIQMSKATPPAIQADLQKINISSQRAAHLVRQLMDFSRKSVRQSKQFDLAPFIREITQFLQRTIPENIRIDLDITPGEYPVDADTAQIQQVITNLVLNARDAMPAGGRLKICLAMSSGNGELSCAICGEAVPENWPSITVSDTGCGIPPHILPHIFEPFFTTKEVGNGVGLGLSQVYGIISQHSGHITVASETGSGTQITISLPPVQGKNEPGADKADHRVLAGYGEKILLVEDEASVLEVNQAMLEKLGYEVITAQNGREAMAVYWRRQADIALVLSDMMMPDMAGEALFHTLKAVNPDIRMVIMSGYPLGEQGEKLLEQGILAWFEKPMSFEQLSQVVRQALGNKKGRWA